MVEYLTQLASDFSNRYPHHKDKYKSMEKSYEKLANTKEWKEYLENVKAFWLDTNDEHRSIGEENIRLRQPVDTSIYFTEENMKCYYYTDRLLSNYRILKEHIENPIYPKSDDDKSKYIFDQLNSAIDKYIEWCILSNDFTNIRRFFVLHDTYIYPIYRSPLKDRADDIKVNYHTFSRDLLYVTIHIAILLFDLDLPLYVAPRAVLEELFKIPQYLYVFGGNRTWITKAI